MSYISKYPDTAIATSIYPHTCMTAAGCLIYKGTVLLIKHKKLGLWLNPGGHIDPGELPHEAAEREFYEETGVFVEAIWTHIDTLPGLSAKQCQANDTDTTHFSEQRDFFTPNPISTNVHWISEKAYLERMEKTTQKKQSSQTQQNTQTRHSIDLNPYKPAVCEQHLCFLYLVRPLGTIAIQKNKKEVDDIGWFSQDEAFALPLKNNIRQELQLAFEMTKQLSK